MARIFRGRIAFKDREKLIIKRVKKGLSTNSLGFRLELFRVHLGPDTYKISILLRISQGSYSEIQSDKSKPSCTTLIKIIELTDNPIDLEWLLLGNNSSV